VSRRASLPGAEELFRKTTEREPRPEPASKQDDKSTKLQVAATSSPAETVATKGPKHEEKVTFYCTGEDLMALERARLNLRSAHGVAADRGRIVRAALAYVLEDFEARANDSILLRRLSE
jgi:hypothetical protein